MATKEAITFTMVSNQDVLDEDMDSSVLPDNLSSRLMHHSSIATDKLAYVCDAVQISSDPSLVAHGRGLIATREIKAGELLFVHPPTVRADVSQVLRIYRNKASACSSRGNLGNDGTNLLESIAETVLLKEMKRILRGRTKHHSNARIAASFLALNKGHSESSTHTFEIKDRKKQQQGLLFMLLGNGTRVDVDEFFQHLEDTGVTFDDNDSLLGIIRHNAFGPDFHHYHRMEKELQANNQKNDASAGTSADSLYARVLGHYPLAAMINHSCGPTNAARVFYGETMVASATMDIAEGHEIRWPYCPPTLPFSSRNEKLTNGYGFVCRCERCLLESRLFSCDSDGGSRLLPPLDIPLDLNSPNNSIANNNSANNTSVQTTVLSVHEWSKLLKKLEIWYNVAATKVFDDNIMTGSIKGLSIRDGLRLGYTQLYIRFFNHVLQQESSVTVKTMILTEATKLHKSFRKVHNASTEHISLVHLCYELSATTSPSQETTNETDSSRKAMIRMWTETLKDVHLSRYSKEIVGKDLGTLRAVLKHTRVVLRTKDGWKTNASSSDPGKVSFL